MLQLPNRFRFIPPALVSATAVGIFVAAAASSATSSTGGETIASSSAPPPAAELLASGTTAGRFDAESGGIELEADRKVDVTVSRLTFSSGSTTGWHRHSGPVVATVTAGQLTLVKGRQCTRHTYRVGDTFVEEGGKVRSKARNNGDTTTETVVVFHLPVGEPPFTPAKAPACAN